MRHGCLEIFVDRNIAALVGGHSRCVQSQPVGITGSSSRPEQDIGFQLFPRFQMQDHSVVTGFHTVTRLAMSNDDTSLSEMIAECIDDLFIQKIQQSVTVVDQVDFDFQVAKHRGVLAADHARTEDSNGLEMKIDVENRVAVEDAGMIEVDIGGAVRPRTCRNDNILSSDR